MRLNLRYIVSTMILLFVAVQSFAQDETVGRTVTKDDWIGFMPIVIGSIMIVIIVNAAFILPIFRKNQNDENSGA